MRDNPAFLKDYNPSGRLVFALTPNIQHISIFETVKKLTGRNLSNMLVSMYYLRGKGGSERLQRIRAFSDTLFIDSGVFTYRSTFLKKMSTGARIAYWKMDIADKDKLLCIGREHQEEFDSFAQEYAKFLVKHSSEVDVAIDLDVDQFLGLEKAEEYYTLLSSVFPREKIMRVWHSHGRNWEDWVDWCKNGNYSRLALEGPDQHNRDKDFYTRMVDVAHQYGVKVHVLAVTTLNFVREVPLDTCDSSTYTVGGRWARLIMPSGRDILVGAKYKGFYGNQFDNISKTDQDWARGIFDYLGFELEELRESHWARTLFNVLSFLVYYDNPMRELDLPEMLF